jgi:hypothetical protein
MVDPLLDQIARAKQQSQQASKAAGKRQYQAKSAKVSRDLTSLLWFWGQTLSALWWIWTNIGQHVWYWGVKQPIYWSWRWYYWSWNKFVWVKDKYGTPTFSRPRGAGFILANVAFFYFIMWPVIMLGVDTGLYTLTVRHDEVLYLHSALPDTAHHDTKDEKFVIQGCDRLPCSDEDSLRFQARFSLFNLIWSLAHHHTIYFEDYVAGAIPPVQNSCVVTTYGVRWKLLIRGIDIYPDLLEVKSCVPIKTVASDISHQAV